LADRVKSAYEETIVANNLANDLRPNEANAEDHVESAKGANDSALGYKSSAFNSKVAAKLVFNKLSVERRIAAQKTQDRKAYNTLKISGWTHIPTNKGVKVTQLLFGLFNRPGTPSAIIYPENDNCASVNAENAAHPRTEFGIQHITDEFNKKDCGYITAHLTEAQFQATENMDLFSSNDVNAQVITILSAGVSGGIDADTVSTPDKCESEFLVYSGWMHYITSKNDEFPATYNCENN